MDTVIAYLGDVGFWHWWALAAFLIAIEILMPSTWLLWPGIAAAMVGLVAAIEPALAWEVQLLTFALLTIVIAVGGREAYAGVSRPSDRPLLNQRGAQYVGRTARVAEAFAEGRGAVHLDDTRWSAATVDGSNPASGSEVRVESVEGTVLNVRPA